MDAVKITDIKEWSSIDIFLFSNGQQYSPPRKYHLRSEELQWWGATLSYLGRTHYGSGHSSIELYAIDGTKINSPLELTNGAAYVAVEPPESFINTGYEEYLLRASRSWEKRLAQKSYNTETPDLADTKKDKDPADQSIIVDIDILEDTADTETLKTGSNIPPQKSLPTKPSQRLQRKCIASSKQIQKKKSFDTAGAVLKRIGAETDKVFPCPKKVSPKKSECTNLKPSTIVNRKINGTNNRELSSGYKKRGSLKTEFSPKTEATNLYDIAPVREPQIIDLFKDDESDLISEKNDLGNKPVIDYALHDQEHNSLTKNCVPISDKTENNQEFEKHLPDKYKEINEHDEQNILLKNETERGQEINAAIINKNKENKSNDNVLNDKSEKQIIDEYVARMNKGGLLLLKVKVKLKDCKSIFNKDESKNIPMSASSSNLLKTEKTSQVDINISFSGEILKSNDPQSTQDKSLQSLLNKLYKDEINHTNSKNPRIIILQCGCHNYSNQKYSMCDTFQGNEVEGRKGETNFNQKLNKAVTSCEYPNDTLIVSKDEYVKQNDMILQTTLDAKEDTLTKENGTCVKDLAKQFENLDTTKLYENYKTSYNKQNDINSLWNKNHRQSVDLARLNGSAVLGKDAENLCEDEYNSTNSKSTCNKSTQTDWCNILLEARLQEDDSYTFHLPSLYFLKQCKL